MSTIASLRRALDPAVARASGAVRRMAITLTTKMLWQLSGVRSYDGKVETMLVELFTGIGLYARPPSGSKPEAIVVMVGDANTPAIVGIRDEQTRAKVAAAIAEGETMLFNDKAVVYLKADGSIEARSASGAAQALATKADLQAVVDYLKKQFDATTGHTHGVVSLGSPTQLLTEAAGPGVTGTCPAPAGTTKLKGE